MAASKEPARAQSDHYDWLGFVGNSNNRSSAKGAAGFKSISGTNVLSFAACSRPPGRGLSNAWRLVALAVDWEDGEPYCCDTVERIKNLHPLAVMCTNIYRKTVHPMFQDGVRHPMFGAIL